MSEIQPPSSNILGLSDRSIDLIKNFLLGGALVGGGTALTTSLLNYLHHIDKKKSEEDDNTLYVYKDRNQVKEAGLGTGIAIAGGLGSALGTAAIVHKIYTELRKAQAQRELDKSQNAFIESQGYKKAPKKKKEQPKNDADTKEPTQEKSSSALPGKGLGLTETIASMPYAVPLLLALATGVVSHKILNDAYPARKPAVKPPQRIQIVDKPEEEEDSEKAASVPDYTDGVEYLVRMIDTTKRAFVGKTSDIVNLINSIAAGRVSEFHKAAADMGGCINALDTIKGASEDVSPLRRHLAISYISKMAGIREVVGLVAAGEFASLFPEMYKAACCLNDEDQEGLFHLGCLMGALSRSEISSDLGVAAPSGNVKAASYGPDRQAGAASLIGTMLDNAKPVATGDSSESTGTSGEEAGIADPDSPSRTSTPKIVSSSKTSKRMVGVTEPDIIDKILSTS